jgi:hypothetical protein
MEHTLAESLGRVVRRVLRTQSNRTSFESQVHATARRLTDSHRGECSRDRLARLVVNELMSKRQGLAQLVGLSASEARCAGTHALMPDSTFAL